MGHGMIDLGVEGMSETQQYFDQPQTPAERNEVASALRAGGDLVIGAAKRRIHSISGDLANSLTTDTTVGRHRSVATVHHGKGGAHDHLVEYGHAPSGWNQSEQPVLPHPYLWPAFEEQKQAAYTKIKDAVVEVLRNR